MISKHATVRNAYGIHCRPSLLIAQAAKDYPGRIEIVGPSGSTTEPASSLAIIALALVCGAEVTITVDGPDEEAMCDRLVELFQRNFDFKR